MRKKLTIKNISIVLGIALAVGLLLFGIAFFLSEGKLGFVVNGGNIQYSYSNNNAGEMPKVKIDKFDKMEINLQGRRVYFVEADDYYIEIVNLDGIDMKVQDDILILNDVGRIKHPGNFTKGLSVGFGDNKYNDIKIWYPKTADFSNLNLDINSSTVYMDNIDILDLDLNLSSSSMMTDSITGDSGVLNCKDSTILIEELYLEEINMFGKSSHVSFDNLKLKEKLFADFKSGTIKMEKLDVKDLDIKVDSTTVTIENGEVANIFADVKAGTLKMDNDIDANVKLVADSSLIDLTIDGEVANYSQNVNNNMDSMVRISSGVAFNDSSLPYQIEVETSTSTVKVNIE